jgi:hypothetical protein
MIEKEEIINTFILNFIQKDRRERCHLQLTNATKRQKFTDKLNHDWEGVFNMKLLTELEKNQNDYGTIRKLLNLKDDELCYLISDQGEYDDKSLPFKEAFELINIASFGTLLINRAADKLFLVTESMQGNTPRFIGKRQAH